MKSLFELLGDYVPGILLMALWLLVFIPRVVVILLLPLNAHHYGHPLYKVQRLVAFDGSWI